MGINYISLENTSAPSINRRGNFRAQLNAEKHQMREEISKTAKERNWRIGERRERREEEKKGKEGRRRKV